MKKRPLGFVCIVFLVIQAIRVAAGLAEPVQSPLESADGKKTKAEGTVLSLEEKEQVYALVLSDCIAVTENTEVWEKKILVYMEKGGDSFSVNAGNRISVEGTLSSFESAHNPGNFDQKEYYNREGISVMLWGNQVSMISGETDWIRELPARLKRRWSELLVRHLGDYYGSTMSAVLLGDKSGLDPQMKKEYQKNGIGHLLAISGLHMSFIGMGIYGLLRRAGLSYIPAGIFGGAVLFLYLIMIGPGVSGKRALLMFLIRVGADMAGRDYDMLTSLLLTAAVLCAGQPFYLTDAGFQLSFGAIFGMGLLGPVFEETFRGLPGKIRSSLAGSLAVSVFLMGPVLFFYFELPTYSVFLNMLVIPIMPLAMGAGLFGSAVSVFWESGGAAILQLCRFVLAFYDYACEAAGNLPGSRFVTGKPGIVWLVAFYGTLACVYTIFYFLPERLNGAKTEKAGRWCRVPGIVLLLFTVGMTVGCRAGYECRTGIRAAVLDVGQGDCIVLHGPDGFVCMTDGGSSDVQNVGQYRIEPYLLSQAADTLDYVFVTHGDEDHVNGVRELLSGQDLGIRIRTLVFPPKNRLDSTLLELAALAGKTGTRTVVMEPGDSICDPTGQFVFSCLGPEYDVAAEAGSNAASLVLSLSYGAFDMLLTGDTEGEGEEALIRRGIGRYDILKVAHHGSKASSSEIFLNMVQPTAAILSAGRENRYGHPHEETIKRLEQAGCRMYSTQKNGAVTAWSDGETMRISGF